MDEKAVTFIRMFVEDDLESIKDNDYSGIIEKLTSLTQDRLEPVLTHLNIVAIETILEAEMAEEKVASGRGKIIPFK